RTMETVVGENPLSFATSRIVTIKALTSNAERRPPLDACSHQSHASTSTGDRSAKGCVGPRAALARATLECEAMAGGHYSREWNRVSSARIISIVATLLLLAGV